MAQTFFYDGQIRRYLTQFIRLMSHFQVEFGKDSQGNVTLQQVPVYYGDSSRQAAQILQGNTENAMPTVPAMACYISGLEYDRTRVQDPTFVSKINVRERSYNSTTDTWGNNQGNAFTVERMMPSPYKLTLKVDIWTSNTNQKLQLQEQIFPLFNPGFEIQSTDNFIDWTSLSTVFLMTTTWTSRTVPMMADGNSVDIATLTFELPIWLSLPAKVKKLGVIQKIIAGIWDANGDLLNDITDLPNKTLLAQRVLTPMQYGLVYYGNTLQLFQQHEIVTDTVDGTILSSTESNSWEILVKSYGTILQNGISEVRLEQPNGTTVVGTVSYHPTDTTLLLFTPYSNSIPSNSLLPINAIIDPHTVSVDDTFIGAVTGTRYLILNDINAPASTGWNGLVAKENDIIEFNGINWIISFAAASETEVKYCTNLKSGIQFKWVPETQFWSKAIEGEYQAGDWAIVLSTTI